MLPVTGITHFTFRRHTCSTCAVWHVWVCVVPLLCGTPWFVPAVHVKTHGLFLTHRTTPWPEECRGAHGWLGWTWTESPLRRGCTCCMALYIIRSLPPWAITSLTVSHIVSSHEQSFFFFFFFFYKILKRSVSETCFCIFSNQKARCNTNTLLHDNECNKRWGIHDFTVCHKWGYSNTVYVDTHTHKHTHTHTYLTVGWSSSGLSLSWTLALCETCHSDCFFFRTRGSYPVSHKMSGQSQIQGAATYSLHMCSSVIHVHYCWKAWGQKDFLMF